MWIGLEFCYTIFGTNRLNVIVKLIFYVLRINNFTTKHRHLLCFKLHSDHSYSYDKFNCCSMFDLRSIDRLTTRGLDVRSSSASFNIVLAMHWNYRSISKMCFDNTTIVLVRRNVFAFSRFALQVFNIAHMLLTVIWQYHSLIIRKHEWANLWTVFV